MKLFFRIAGVVLLTLIAVSNVTVQAQDLRDPGIREPYHPSFVDYRIGLYYVIREDYDRALSEFTAAIDKLPGFAYAYTARGDVHALLGEYDMAIADYTTAIGGIYPDLVSALYTRGRAYHSLGEVDLALADCENAIEQLPEYALPYWGLGDLYFEQARYGWALENYHHYLALSEDEPDALMLERLEALQVIAADAL